MALVPIFLKIVFSVCLLYVEFSQLTVKFLTELGNSLLWAVFQNQAVVFKWMHIW